MENCLQFVLYLLMQESILLVIIMGYELLNSKEIPKGKEMNEEMDE